MQKNTIQHRIENIENTTTDKAPIDPLDIAEMFSRLTPENREKLKTYVESLRAEQRTPML